ncbi:MAG: TldD/PmbA family protein [Candidatus Thermoplasmatota archaeon]|nr:TldD/PmbA family protein [Candidatus Thermoplasmatota archaeon]
MVDLSDIAEKTVRHVTKQGASDCDVVVTDSWSISAEIEKGSMKQASHVSDPGVGVRAFVGGCSGFASCAGFDRARIRSAAERALALARSGTPDPDFKGLPAKERPTKAEGLFERRLQDVLPEDAVAMAIELAESAAGDRRIYSVNAGVSVGVGQIALANSNGFSACQKMTAFEVGAEAVAKSGQKMFSGVDVGGSRRFDRKLLSSVGSEAKEHALMGLSQCKVATGDYPVVLDPLAVGFLFEGAIGGGLNAESVQRKRSYMAGKLGQKVGSEELTVLDDPTLRWANGSYSFDGEGIPAKRRTLLDRGTLKSYLHDSYTAGKDSIRSTGNSSRGKSLWTFRRPPAISSSNLVIKRGDASVEEMCRESRNGIYLRLTFDYPNLATGELSGLMMESFRIEKGELGPSIRQSTIGISLLEMYSRIDLVGKDSRDAFGVRAPAMRISSARIGGSR